jgi:hypothetical protein
MATNQKPKITFVGSVTGLLNAPWAGSLVLAA